MCSSENFFILQMWYLRSPPVSRSITRYRFSLSWNAQLMLMMKLTIRCIWGYLFFRMDSSWSSFMTELTLFFETILRYKKHTSILPCFWHDLHSMHGFAFFALHYVDLTETSPSNHIKHLVVRDWDGLNKTQVYTRDIFSFRTLETTISHRYVK